MTLTRRDMLALAAAPAALDTVLSARPATTAQRPGPNVLFVMSDQHNARALGCYGSKEVRTPNLDALAAAGVRFSRAYCQTGQCVPSRYSIWTGRYARSTGTYSNAQTQNATEQTVGDLFKAAGYVTATIGKHHMQMTAANGNHGFDYVSVPRSNIQPPPDKALPYEQVHPGRSRVGPSPLPNARHTAGRTAAETIQFLRKNRDKPFVVWCSFYGPHTPICPSQPWAGWYDAGKLTLPPNHRAIDRKMPGCAGLLAKSGTYPNEKLHRQTLAYYYGLVSQIDHNIGLVLAALDKLGLAENTVVVYTADHGEMMAEHGAWTKGRTGYEATLRVPMILRSPGVLPKGRSVDELACSIDLLPTLLDLAGLKTPKNVQGRSLMPLARGQAKAWRQYAFSELGSSTQQTCLAVVGKTHKYVLFRMRGQTEYEQLFDLRADPWESKNLAGEASAKADLARMRQALADWEKTTPGVEPQPVSRRPKRRKREGPPAKRPARDTARPRRPRP